MNRLPDIGQVSDLRLGDHPGFDAWFYSFCAENNIEHGINPSGVASPEQLRFMVAMDERQVYAPCSDATFRELAASFHLRSFPPRVRSQYIAAWRSIIRVVRYEKDRQKRRDMINYCRHRFRGCLALGNILPSRLVKRLVTTLISHFDAGDPWLNERLFYNETLASFLRSQTLQKALGRLPDGLSAEGIPDLRRALDLAELARLFHLAGRSHHTLTQLIHNCAAAESGKCELPDIFTGSEAFTPQVEELFPGPPRTFLYICAMEGGLALDLRIIQTLLRLGHKVILTLKEAPVYYAPTVWDVDRDPLLVDNLPESHIFKAPAASKNELLRRLRENRLLIISDGTGERLNLYRTSVTFARAWKESDAIIARGRCNRDVLLGTSHLFTRDVFCFWEDRGEVRMQLKPHAPGIRKFSEQALTATALVFAMFKLNPAPFCLLDEVDAPLDEANQGRLARLCTEMSADTQFLIITHHRVTMEYAKALIGVTMKEPGVSRVVSVDIAMLSRLMSRLPPRRPVPPVRSPDAPSRMFSLCLHCAGSKR